MKVPPATLIVPVVVLLAVGVNVAVYPVPDPANAERVPPTTTISPEVKLDADSERVNVSHIVEPEFTTPVLVPIVIVGTVAS